MWLGYYKAIKESFAVYRITLPDEKILFTGDLLFVECHPWLGDGFTNDWIDYLNDLKKLNLLIIVPGHGSLGNIKNIDQMISYIQKISERVNDAVKNNLTEEEISAIPISDEFSNWWFDRFYIPNIVIQMQR